MGRKAALAFIKAYQRFLSPLLPRSCRFEPSCSNYALQAIELHGLIRGAGKAAFRLMKCHPLHRGGYDPVN